MQYVHTNIIAENWQELARFYVEVFGCKQLGPERHLSGKWVDELTGIKGCKIDGVHLTMPGYEGKPTLEIFSYSPSGTQHSKKVNNIGLGHLAFHVDNVEETIKDVMRHGGKQYGEIVCEDYGKELGVLTAAYVTDVEENIIEVQNWKK